MAETRRLSRQFDIEQLLLEAQQRWLRPVEICEILQNFRAFRIAPEPPQKPPSGSLFLFDRKVLRYFRKDGHNWRKKKDGKTVKEAHERLKADSVDVLHCYYAHGEENENFQRRTYWMLEEALMHIVLVHYLEVKGSKGGFNRVKDDDDIASATRMDSPVCSDSFTGQSHLPSQTMEIGSPNSTQTSVYADAESDNHHGRSRYHPFVELQQYVEGPQGDVNFSNTNAPLPSQSSQYEYQELPSQSKSGCLSVAQENMTKLFNGAGHDLQFNKARTLYNATSWEEVIGNEVDGFQRAFKTIVTVPGNISGQDDLEFHELLPDDLISNQKEAANDQNKANSQILDSEGSLVLFKTASQNDLSLNGKMNGPSLLKQASLDLSNVGGDGLKKYDSFSRWMSKELGEVDDSHMKSSSQSYWNFIESENVEDSSMTTAEHLDSYTMSPSVSQDQLFSILDFSPNWAFTGFETKVLITGTFLKDRKDLENCKWSCMFGEVEVPAEIIAGGVLRCDTPLHKSGTVPFYITCSNRLACSEVREFEFRDNYPQCMDTTDSHSHINELYLHVRLGKLLSLGYSDQSTPVDNMTEEKINLSYKISSLLMDSDDEWLNMLETTSGEEFCADSSKDRVLQTLLKEQLHDWLLRKIAEGGKGPCVLDKEGQGVLHLAAAVGYDWAIKPTITAGVGINFRDVRGWTALHWAAFCGRERTVVSLVTLGAASGALTDPTPEFPSGRTPADLASANGHKGIAGFLAESSLTAHLETLTLKNTDNVVISEVTCTKDMEDFVEKYDVNAPGEPSMKDSLTAVRKATLAAARIHQVFRVQSFQRKKLLQYNEEMSGISDKQALSRISIKANTTGEHNTPAHVAAIRIQNKFRGWKGRKEFLIIRKRIVKIQAHIRGHQVRKRYKKIVWTVGIMEKVILRWRRKGSGLRGFRSEGLLEGSSGQEAQPQKEEDYDFLQEGRKQAEARMQKALSRVKSMVQYPEARDQYSRLLNVVSELQKSNMLQDRSSHEVDDVNNGDFMMEFEELWEEDSNIPAS
ncbi:calmodulin-binding transcription activator 3 isoform X2 [Dendrobium catenatum]|uniref:calmodulin-binding transcription activator 3 isoform X2 n=1 Tax=Dendrobium catenatum TaxID=906689 RepID=UPI0009F468AF|nr:calmodulin-binding transcription activator 3 isoform X2 [Dendrobium catenatum]